MYGVNDHRGKPDVWMVRMGDVEAADERRARLAGWPACSQAGPALDL
jgi:hypothetical protein